MRIAKAPVAWKKGTASSVPRIASGSGAGMGSPLRRYMRAWHVVELNMLEITARWVASAPFGLPVVPDVYMMVASSSGPSSTPDGPASGRSAQEFG